MMTSRRLAVRPAILLSESPSTMIMGESTAEDLGVQSLEARAGLAPVALPWLGRAADANTALLATQTEAIFTALAGEASGETGRVRIDMRRARGDAHAG